MFATNVSLTALPNPCVKSHFQPPIYEFSDFKFIKTFPQDDNWGFYSYTGTVDFRLSDIANNYTLFCNWGYPPTEDSYGNNFEHDNCVTANGEVPLLESRALTLLRVDKENIMRYNNSLSSPIKLTQLWYCDIVNGSYPEAYQARAEVFLDVTCPNNGLRNKPEECVIKTQLPVRIKAQWMPRGTSYPNTPVLTHKPTPMVAPKGLDPPPTRDCTGVSFQYPDWFLHDFTYVYPTVVNDPETARLNFSLTSRATGVRVQCFWGKVFGVTFRDVHVGDYYMWPSCDPASPEPDPLLSQTVYTMGYNRDARTLKIEQEWVCGDTSGRYSTRFAAEPKFQSGVGNFPNEQQTRIPLYCTGNACTADPMLIEGRLTKPLSFSPAQLPGPEGANTPQCLFNSDLRGWTWTIEHFLWQATTARMINGGGFFPITDQATPYNRTLQVRIRNAATGVYASCNFNDAALDGETDRWWPCFRSRQQDPHIPPQQHVVETYVQFSAKTGQLAINQTWYCNDTEVPTPYKITAYGRSGLPGSSGLVCGSGTNTVEKAPCPLSNAWGWVGNKCDYTFAARWCTLGDRDGNGNALWVGSDNTTFTRLAQRELTEPEPDPNVWSCTESSLGRGPVAWRLTTAPRDYFASTQWFDPARQYHPDSMETTVFFDLDNSVFRGRPDGDSVIRWVGITADTITPWVTTHDPTRVYSDRSVYSSLQNPGWSYYNVLGWVMRVDLAKGYLEVNHSWYCDDKDREKPIVFNGTWSGYLPLNCSYEFTGLQRGGWPSGYVGGIYCRLAERKKEIVVTPSVTHSISDAPIPSHYIGLGTLTATATATLNRTLTTTAIVTFNRTITAGGSPSVVPGTPTANRTLTSTAPASSPSRNSTTTSGSALPTGIASRNVTTTSGSGVPRP